MLPRGTVDWRAHAPEQPWELGPLDALQAAGRGRRLPAHRARGQPADGPAPARPARPRRGARGGARAAPRDGQARDRGVVLQLDAGRLLVAHVGRAARPGRGRGDRLRRGRLGRRDPRPARPSPRRRSGRRSPGSSSAPFPSPRRRACELALHPDDPPLSPVRGIGRIIRSLDAYDRVFELQPSAANGMTFCQGNITLMTDDLPAAIRHFGEAGRIHFVHFRDVRGTPEQLRRDVRRRRPDRHGRVHPRVPRRGRRRAAAHRPLADRSRATRRSCRAIRRSAACTRSATSRACSPPARVDAGRRRVARADTCVQRSSTCFPVAERHYATSQGFGSRSFSEWAEAGAAGEWAATPPRLAYVLRDTSHHGRVAT